MRILVLGIMLIGEILQCTAQTLDSITLSKLRLSTSAVTGEEKRGSIYKQLGDHYYETAHYPLAKTYYDSALAEYSTNTHFRGEVLRNQSYVLLRLGEFRKSLASLDALIPILEEDNDSVYLCKCYNRKGYNLIKLSKADSSVSYYIKALKCFEKLNDQVSVINELNNLSNVLYRMEDDEKGMYYLEKAYERALDLQDTTLLTTISSNLAIRYAYLSKLDSAWYHAQNSLSFARILGLNRSVVFAHTRMALISLKKEEFQRSILYADSTLQSGTLNLGGFVTAYKYKAEAYLKLARYDSALLNINRAISKARQGKDLEEIFELYQLSSDIHEAMGSMIMALQHYKEYSILKDSALNLAKLGKIETLMTQYETEKKVEEIKRLTQENEIKDLRNNQQLLTFAVVLALIILAAMTIGFYLKQRIIKKDAQIAIRKEQLLRSQINPHFIFNALSSIRGFLFDEKDLHLAIDYLGKFAKLMRMILDHSSQELVTLEEELRALKIYMEIQQMRFNHNFEFNIDIDPAIQADQIKVPPLLAQPFIENAIEHGFKNISYQGKIDFKCKSEGHLIRFSIVDNGVGINSIQNDHTHESKALLIFKERLDLLSAQLKTSLSFLINDMKKQDGPSGTHIEYTLPIL